MALQHLRSSTANKRPDPTAMAAGQLALNSEATSPGLFFKNSSGNLVKVGPVHVGTTAPNATPASGGTAGNSIGEQWLDTSGTNPIFKIWTGSTWASENGEFVNASGDTMTGALVMDNQQQVRFRETTANGTNYIAIQAPASVATDKTLTLPDANGTLVSTGDTGTVTSTMIADGTIVDADVNASAAIAYSKLASLNSGNILVGNASNVATSTAVTGDVTISNAGVTAIATGVIVNADVNASAAIAGTKISPDFGSQNTTTTGTSTAASFIPTSSTAPTNGVYLPAANSVAISTNGSGRLFVDSSGRVGIGTTPTVPLEVAASGAGIKNVLNIKGAISTTGEGGAITFSNQDPASFQLAKIASVFEGGTFSGSLRFYTNTNNDGASPTEKMRILSDGKVGIGTASPGKTLDVVGTIRSNTTSAALELTSSNAGSGSISFLGAGSYEAYIQSISGGGIYFGTGSSATERARIDSSGRLLVGTSSTSSVSTLVLQGNSGASGDGAVARLTCGSATPTNGTDLGYLLFADSSHADSAAIRAQRDGGTWSGSSKPTRLVFSTCSDGSATPVERMRIKSNGFTELTNDGVIAGGDTHIVRSSSNADTLIVRNSNTSLSAMLLRLAATRNTSNGTYNFFNCVREGVENVLYIRDSGNVVNINNSYGAISDIKLKENIVDAGSQWDDLKALQVRKYNFKEGQTHTQIGLIAQEVELVSPGLVSESPDRDEDGNDLGTVTKSVNYSVLYMKAVKALQEAMERIETLEAKVAALEAS